MKTRRRQRRERIRWNRTKRALKPIYAAIWLGLTSFGKHRHRLRFED